MLESFLKKKKKRRQFQIPTTSSFTTGMWGAPITAEVWLYPRLEPRVHMVKKSLKESLRTICQIWHIKLQNDKDLGKSYGMLYFYKICNLLSMSLIEKCIFQKTPFLSLDKFLQWKYTCSPLYNQKTVTGVEKT